MGERQLLYILLKSKCKSAFIYVRLKFLGTIIELRERAFLFEVKPEGLIEYSPGIRI
jgi:hypothetical protein